MSNKTNDVFELPDDLRRLQSSLAHLEPSNVQISSAEMLFAAGLAAGVKHHETTSSNQRSGRWGSLTIGISTGIITALIASRLLSSTFDSHRVVDTASSERGEPQDVATNSRSEVSDTIVSRRTDRAPRSMESFKAQLLPEFNSAEQKIWERIGKRSLDSESLEFSVKPVTFRYLTGRELQTLAAETL